MPSYHPLKIMRAGRQAGGRARRIAMQTRTILQQPVVVVVVQFEQRVPVPDPKEQAAKGGDARPAPSQQTKNPNNNHDTNDRESP